MLWATSAKFGLRADNRTKNEPVRVELITLCIVQSMTATIHYKCSPQPTLFSYSFTKLIRNASSVSTNKSSWVFKTASVFHLGFHRERVRRRFLISHTSAVKRLPAVCAMGRPASDWQKDKISPSSPSPSRYVGERKGRRNLRGWPVGNPTIWWPWRFAVRHSVKADLAKGKG